VDYSAHIAHSFVVSNADSPEERVIEALKTMGASVAMGGFSTFLGMLATAFASSEVFRIFFKMIFSIVVLGLLHGLLFLPVYLSLFCRTKITFEKEKNANEVCLSPAKLSLDSHHPATIHQSHVGKIGSKVIPVASGTESIKDVSIESLNYNNNDSSNNNGSSNNNENSNNNDVNDTKNDIDT